MHNLRNTPRNYDYDSLQIALSNKRLVKKVCKMNLQLIRLKSAYNVLQYDFTEVQMRLLRVQLLCFLYTLCMIAYVIYTICKIEWDPDLTHVNYFVEKGRLFWDFTVNVLSNTGYNTQRDSSL
jgi:hypothetical protein